MPRPRKPKSTEPKRKRGRPSSYTEEMAERLCKHIAGGNTATSFCALPDMPHIGTVMRWVAENAHFREAYARAREMQAEAFADQITAIADGDGDPNDKRVRIDARKWIAARLLPKKYGDRVLHDTTEAAAEALSNLELARRIAFVLQGVGKQPEDPKLIEHRKDEA